MREKAALNIENLAMSDLNSRQIKFVRNLLIGMTYTDAYVGAGYHAKNDTVAAANASRLIANDKVKAFWDEEKAKLLDLSRSRIVSLALDALPVVQSVMTTSKDDFARLGAAKDILDRAGLKPETKIELGGEGRVIINFLGLEDDDFPDSEE